MLQVRVQCCKHFELSVDYISDSSSSSSSILTMRCSRIGSLLNDFVPIAPWLRLCTTAGGIIFGGAQGKPRSHFPLPLISYPSAAYVDASVTWSDQGHAIGANTLECQELILACTVEELIVGLAGSLAAGSTSAFTTYLGVSITT